MAPAGWHSAGAALCAAATTLRFWRTLPLPSMCWFASNGGAGWFSFSG